MTDGRDKQTEAAERLALAGGLALAVLKAAAGMAAGSKALIADGLHSAAGSLGSLASLIGLRAAEEPDSGRLRAVSSIVLSVLLLVMGIETGITSLKTILSGTVEAPERYALIVLVVTVIAGEAIYQFRLRPGTGTAPGEQLYGGSGVHRSGLYAAMAALVGIGGAILGDYLGNNLLYYLDPAAGIVIAVLILRMGYLTVMESVVRSLEKVLGREDAADLIETVQRVKGVIAVDDLQARELGHYVIVDVRISVNPRITIQEGHEIARIVKQTLMKRFSHITEVLTQVSPYDPGYPYKGASRDHDDVPTLLH
ncbi:cation diffusion facilitator family transporter [Paenibacillus mucilaginosus]|uniref:Cobalt-zinc-cadmium resistance protein n=1 Tax=Paenibacillus mucilaginosus (strain KNP414) TaxID=1036673 RepID=F8FMW6_PAEMK|nr:cation diffusion facilitator family transporter [Paenibacillus mucilaginosus]AEI44926.1 cobalt-zinc-cadmium resistance protein [Paenibacillus mucilaginosus KNP414]MCG7214966.1 cation diffusion facilitator family transporter [Paenibacillus mucilaginosus]WDM26439.1 cation transporter [Paenibacillus mucilaginosus]